MTESERITEAITLQIAMRIVDLGYQAPDETGTLSWNGKDTFSWIELYPKKSGERVIDIRAILPIIRSNVIIHFMKQILVYVYICPDNALLQFEEMDRSKPEIQQFLSEFADQPLANRWNFKEGIYYEGWD